MADQWYYTHAEAIHGPVSSAELRLRMLAEAIVPEDLIWPAGADPTAAVPVEAALAFSLPTAVPLAPAVKVTTPTPDWVSKLAEVLATVRDPAALPNPSPASWLPDIEGAKKAPTKES